MTSWSSRLLMTAAGLAGVVLLTVSAAGGTHAMWSSDVVIPGAVLTAGNADMDIQSPEALAPTPLFPGQTTSVPFSVHNTGTVALGLAVDTLTWNTAATEVEAQPSSAQEEFAQALIFNLWPDSGSGCEVPAPGSSWQGTAPFSSGDLGITVAPDAIQKMCLATTLSLTAPNSAQGASLDFQLTLEGIQQ
ncbi:hypothetical protein COCCU_12785 [Corynebacterium occultum]|uniref:Ribosomally synthesized peptide with SipW-like signal peptide n=1 Tax=Corynebacterium occultum TaxID=2675219 RepID=A0A6B8W923_9CORY|nr:hypothetical protein [Corynebacterium occultum]QGU08457.1 hypothetical protein COCCU_12785 [Corynebacterium occultum]